MKNQLINLVTHFIQQHADSHGIAETGIDGVMAAGSNKKGPVSHLMFKPLICLVLQGSKKVTLGHEEITVKAGQSMVISTVVPISNEIINAAEDKPYVSLVIDLDLSVIAELDLEINHLQSGDTKPIQSSNTDDKIIDVSYRLMKLVSNPQAIAILSRQLIRELHYWLLVGEQGRHLSELGKPDSIWKKVNRATAKLRNEYMQPLLIGQLAECAGMSMASFYQHFRSITNLTPKQYQKQLRLIEANRLMKSQGLHANSAAFAVGYESVSHFSRDYSKMFGLPPKRHVDRESSL